MANFSKFRKGSVLMALAVLISFLGWEMAGAATKTHIFGIFGGRIRDMRSVSTGAGTSEIWVSTEGPNTLFRAQVSSGAVSPFDSVAGMSAVNNHGIALDFDIHYTGAKTCAYVSVDNSLYHSAPVAGFNKLLRPDGSEFTGAQSVAVYSGLLFVAEFNGAGASLYRGAIQSDCSVVFDPFVIQTGPGPGGAQLQPDGIKIGPSKAAAGNFVYLFLRSGMGSGGTEYIGRTADPYDALSSTTTFTLFPGPLAANSMAVAPDGRVWISVEDPSTKEVDYTDNEGVSWTNVPTGYGGVAGPISIYDDKDGLPSTYRIYDGSVRSNDSGSTWLPLCAISYATHPNDGEVTADANDTDLLFLTTDQGLGFTSDAGDNCQEVNDGIAAVTVNGIFVNDVKEVAWAVSKSGVWRSVNFNKPKPTWSEPAFPQYDGSPYWSIAVDPVDPENTAFAGNCRIYRTTTGPGSSSTNWDNWERLLAPITEAGSAPSTYNFEAATVRAIQLAKGPGGVNYVYAGLSNNKQESDPVIAGGYFASCDNGDIWQQVDLGTGNPVPGQEANIYDVLPAEDAGTDVVFIAAEALPPGTGLLPSGGIYMAEAGCTASVVTHDLPDTSLSIFSLAKDVSGQVFAAGMDSSYNRNVYQRISAGNWQVIGTGLGTAPDWQPLKLTVGSMPGGACSGKVPYVGFGNTIYYLGYTDSSCTTFDSGWSLYFAYPQGVSIKSLIWDELMAGTEVGLHGISGSLSSISVTSPAKGTVWQPGASKAIQWKYTGNPGTHVKISLLEDGQPYETIVAKTPVGAKGAGSYKWKIPSDLPFGSSYSIKISSVSLGSIAGTSAVFEIGGMRVTSPVDGDVWKMGKKYQIRWSYGGKPGSFVKIELLKAGKVAAIISKKTNAGSKGKGSFKWAVPSKSTQIVPGKGYRVRVSSTQPDGYSAVSEGDFEIAK